MVRIRIQVSGRTISESANENRGRRLSVCFAGLIVALGQSRLFKAEREERPLISS
jgi:hypothetical protein